MRLAYAQSEEGIEAGNRAKRKYIESNPEKRAAHKAVYNAVRNGSLIPWPVCAVPECTEEHPQAHHPDYSRPLDVVWLCAAHHKATHDLVV